MDKKRLSPYGAGFTSDFSPLMSRPSLKAKFIASAIKRFQESGFKTCTIEDIANDAGAFKGSFYNHFKSKEAIAVATVEIYSGGGISMLEMGGPLSPVQRLRLHFVRMTAYSKKHSSGQGCLIANFSAEVSDETGELRRALNKAMNNWYKVVATVIRQGQKVGEIDKRHDPNQLARCLVNAWEGTSLRVKVTKSMHPVDDFLTITLPSLLR